MTELTIVVPAYNESSVLDAFHARALAVLTVSDHLVTGEQTTSEERQRTFSQMIQIALDAAVQFAGGA